MFALAAEASVMPFHEDWLNERSSTPPVSSTMQALNAAAEAEGLEAAVLGAVLGDELPAAGVLLEPHAANASAATPITAAALSCFFTRILLGWTRSPSRSRDPGTVYLPRPNHYRTEQTVRHTVMKQRATRHQPAAGRRPRWPPRPRRSCPGGGHDSPSRR